MIMNFKNDAIILTYIFYFCEKMRQHKIISKSEKLHKNVILFVRTDVHFLYFEWREQMYIFKVSSFLDGKICFDKRKLCIAFMSMGIRICAWKFCMHKHV